MPKGHSVNHHIEGIFYIAFPYLGFPPCDELSPSFSACIFPGLTVTQAIRLRKNTDSGGGTVT